MIATMITGLTRAARSGNNGLKAKALEYKAAYVVGTLTDAPPKAQVGGYSDEEIALIRDMAKQQGVPLPKDPTKWVRK